MFAMNHCDYLRGREGLGHRDEKSCEDEEGREVHHHHGLEEERFEECGGVDDSQDEECGQVGRQQLVHNSPLQDQRQNNPLVRVAFISV